MTIRTLSVRADALAAASVLASLAFALMLFATPAAAETLTGTVVAPAGQSARGTVAIACEDTDPKKCITSPPVTEDARIAKFTVPGISPRASYTIVLWKDNGDGKMGDGDFVGTFMNRPIDPSKLRLHGPGDYGFVPLVAHARLGNKDKLSEPFPGKGVPLSSLSQVTGTWLNETSDGGAGLASGTGPAWQSMQFKGGLSATVIREKWMRDAIVLTIRDGNFTWYSPTDTFDDNNCARAETTEQSGTVGVEKDNIVLKSREGKTMVVDSCHPEKNGPVKVDAGTGYYAVALAEGPDKRMRMKLFDGKTNFVFVKVGAK